MNEPVGFMRYRNASYHGGIDTRSSGRLISDIEATQLLNVDISTPGLRRKRKGLFEVADLVALTVTPPPGDNGFFPGVVLSNARIHQDSNGTWFQIKDSITGKWRTIFFQNGVWVQGPPES